MNLTSRTYSTFGSKLWIIPESHDDQNPSNKPWGIATKNWTWASTNMDFTPKCRMNWNINGNWVQKLWEKPVAIHCFQAFSTPPRSRGSICRGACPCVSPMCDTSTAISPRVLGELLIVFGVARWSSSTVEVLAGRRSEHIWAKKWRKTWRLNESQRPWWSWWDPDIYC